MTAARTRLGAALAALLVSAATGPVATASAEQGLWDGVPGVQHLHFQTAPLAIHPGQNGITNLVVPASQKPGVDGFIVRMRPNLVGMDGKPPPVDVLHLHHGVWINTSGRSPAGPTGELQPIFLGGEEKTVFRIPRGYGYAYKATDGWSITEMIHNSTPNPYRVRLVWDLDFIPASSPLAPDIKPVVPLWADVRRGWGYPAFDVRQGDGGADGRFTFPRDARPSPYGAGPRQNEFTLPYAGTVVTAVGHLHPGGLHDDISVARPGAGTRMVFRSKAVYYDPRGPISWDMSLTASRPDWRVRLNAGDVVSIQSTYDSRHASWYESMGVVMLYVAPDDLSGPDPFAVGVDPNGELTHGRLPESGHHGGDARVYPDPRTAASGPVARRVVISDYRFVPGDLGSLFDRHRIPLVPRGQSLTFVNRDDVDVEWHSITTCRAPCNLATGVSYPLADGLPGTQFDSGQLGFGPSFISPAADRVTWRTPPSLDDGTYTYFCRIHPFMRGAFRVR